ncbi:hypothetical protein HRbin27_01211 [bacterium HR27]|nr:hypothetical protein HRbin27_01211 [bacterium HR27]
MFRHIERWTSETITGRETRVRLLPDDAEHILDVENPANVIWRAPDHRQARESGTEEVLDRLLERHRRRHCDHVDARDHHRSDGDLAELEGVLDEPGLLPAYRALPRCDIEQGEQFLTRHAGNVPGIGDTDSTQDERRCTREEPNDRCCDTREPCQGQCRSERQALGVLHCQRLRHEFAQHDTGERKPDGHDHESDRRGFLLTDR